MSAARVLDFNTDGGRHRRRREHAEVASMAGAIARIDRAALRRLAAWLRAQADERPRGGGEGDAA